MDTKKDKLLSEFPPVSTAEWEARILEDLKGADYNKKLIWKTNEGIDVRPYYRSENTEGLTHMSAGPGEYPYVRGTQTRSNKWDIRQDIETDDPTEANFQALAALRRGADSVCFNASKIKTVRQLESLMKGLCFGECSLHFGSAPSYPDLASLLEDFVKKHRIHKIAIRGSFDFDPISYLLLEGNFYRSEESDMAQVGEMIGFRRDMLPGIKVITVNGQYFQNAGSTLVQELAFSLASGNEYLSRATDAGFSIDETAPALMFSFAIGSNYFMEIAKLRAARMLWARIVEQYSPASAESMQMNIHCSTSNFNKSIYDPYVNILRTTTEAMSAIIGGTGSMSVTPFDAFYKDTDEFSSRIARNQQIVLREESYLENVVDPAAGSYYIESMTDSIAKAAWELFREIETMGGMLQAVKSGYIQDEIAKQAAARKLDVATRKTVVLGTNQYPNLLENMLEKIQEGEVDEDEDDEKPITYKKLEICRATDDFDSLRLATEIYIEAGNKRPSVFLLTIGNLAMRKARAMFSTNFFGCAGYHITDNPGFATATEAVKAAAESKADIVVICSSDEEYATLAPEIARELKAANPSTLLFLAGYPKEILDDLKQSGIDDFIHIRTNVYEFLKKTQNQLNIPL